MVFRGCCLVVLFWSLRNTAALRILEDEERTSPGPTPVPTQSLAPTIAPTETRSTSDVVAEGSKNKSFCDSIRERGEMSAPLPHYFLHLAFVTDLLLDDRSRHDGLAPKVENTHQKAFTGFLRRPSSRTRLHHAYTLLEACPPGNTPHFGKETVWKEIATGGGINIRQGLCAD